MTRKGRSDKRNKLRESGNWRPHRWTPGKISRYMLHVQKASYSAFADILGANDGNKVAATVKAQFGELKSAAVLKAMGVKLIGDQATITE